MPPLGLVKAIGQPHQWTGLVLVKAAAGAHAFGRCWAVAGLGAIRVYAFGQKGFSLTQENVCSPLSHHRLQAFTVLYVEPPFIGETTNPRTHSFFSLSSFFRFSFCVSIERSSIVLSVTAGLSVDCWANNVIYTLSPTV